MIAFRIPVAEIQVLLMIFLRISAILFSLPFFESPNIPMSFKINLALAVSLMLLPIVGVADAPVWDAMIPFIIGMVNEILLGAFIGLAVRVVFAAFMMAGQLVGFQMGFAIANVMDPATTTQVSVTAQIYNIAVLLIFLAIDGHCWFIGGIVDTFRYLPPMGVHIDGRLAGFSSELVGRMFVMSIKIGAPVIVALLLCTVALGLTSRTVPQMNVFFVATPINIAIGLFFIGLSLPVMIHYFSDVMAELIQFLDNIVRDLRV